MYQFVAQHAAHWISANGGTVLGCHPWAVRPNQAICQAVVTYNYTGQTEIVSFLSWHSHIPFGNGIASKMVQAFLLTFG